MSLRIGDHVRRVGVTVALATCLLGCGSPDTVPLLTGTGEFSPDDHTCYLNYADGTLIVDPAYGTAIVQDLGDGSPTFVTPVMWWPGFTGRRHGTEIQVIDTNGKVVAETGRRYRIGGGTWAETLTPTKENHYAFEGPRFWLACEVFPE